MKHVTKISILLLTILLLGGLFSSCSQDTPETPDVPDTPDIQEHVHKGARWYTNKKDHWQVCSCGIIINKQAHSGGEATHESAATCEICKMKYGEHLHDFGDWKSNGTYHLKKCSCGKESDKGKHTGGTATYESGPICEVCGIEYGEHIHTIEGWGYNNNSHWQECPCGKRFELAPHSGGMATCESAPICEVCGNEYGEHAHTGVTEWISDGIYHWKECSCGKKVEKDIHNSSSTEYITACDDCGTLFSTFHSPTDDHTHTPLGNMNGDSTYHWYYCKQCYGYYNIGEHTGGTATVDARAVCEICNKKYGELVPLDIPNLIQGDIYQNDESLSFYMISSAAYPISNFVSHIVNQTVSKILSNIYQPLYWAYYLRGLGYTQTVSVTQSQKQRIHFILNGDTFYAEPYYDVQYTAYDKDGNVIEFSEEHGKNPVGDMLKRMLSDVYDVKTGEVVGESVFLSDKPADETDATPYKATGTGREASTAPQDGMASVLTVNYTDINIKLPENYLEDCLYYNHHGRDYPAIFGIEYSIDGLKDEELEDEINTFIADACKRVEEKFAEAYNMYSIFSVKDYYSYCLDGNIFYAPPEGVPQHIRPSVVEITGQNGYLSVLVYTGFAKVANDDGEPCPYYALSATYDLRTGERLEAISDLFPKDSEFVDKLNDSLKIVVIASAGFSTIHASKPGDPVLLTEKEVEVFTYNSIVLPFYSSIFDLGCIATFSCDSLAYEYCDMKQFFTEDFKGYISDKKIARALSRNRFIPIGTSSSAGVYIPENASPALVKAAEQLAEYAEQLVCEEVALKLYHDAGYTEIVRVEHTFPRFFAYEVGNMFYQFELYIENTSDWGEEVYTAYDAEGNIVYAGYVGVIDADPFMNPFYYFQDTGEKVTFVLKEGWEQVTTVSLHREKYVYSELEVKPEINMHEVDFWTGTYDVLVDFPSWGRAFITIPREYILPQ